MANTFNQICLQTVFAVKYRQAVLDKPRRSKAQGVIGCLIHETGCKTIIANGVEDHMHCFAGLRPAVSVSELMKPVKAKSSKYINDHNRTKKDLSGRKDMVCSPAINGRYHLQIHSNQEEHHKIQTYSEFK